MDAMTASAPPAQLPSLALPAAALGVVALLASAARYVQRYTAQNVRDVELTAALAPAAPALAPAVFSVDPEAPAAEPVQPTVHKPDLSGVLPAEFAEIKQRLDSFSFTPVAPAPTEGVAPAVFVVNPQAKPDSERVVITGSGVVSCFGNDVDEFYQALLDGKSGVKPITGYEGAEKLQTNFAAQITDFSTDGLVNPKQDKRLDPYIRYSLVASKKAMQQAKFFTEEDMEGVDKTRVGVLVGSGMGGLKVIEDNVISGVANKKKMSPFFIPYAITNMGSALVAIDYGFMGPNYPIPTACATANYCFYAAANHIRKGEADIVIAGGAEAAVTEMGIRGFIACRALSDAHKGTVDVKTASRPWDKGRDGFVMGEGAGVLVMESLASAKKRGANILCEYLGGSISCDAYGMTDPHPEGKGVALCMNSAMADAGIEPEDINYINAHATSTPVGDVAEISALRKVFPSFEGKKMNATKSMIGHGLGAAGGLEAVAVVKAIETGMLHPTLNQDDLEEVVSDIDTCAGGPVKHDITAAISNSFGFGGHNSAVIFAPYKE